MKNKIHYELVAYTEGHTLMLHEELLQEQVRLHERRCAWLRDHLRGEELRQMLSLEAERKGDLLLQNNRPLQALKAYIEASEGIPAHAERAIVLGRKMEQAARGDRRLTALLADHRHRRTR